MSSKINETLQALNNYWTLFQQEKISPQDIAALSFLSYYHFLSTSPSFYQLQKHEHLPNNNEIKSYSMASDPFILNILALSPTKNAPMNLYELFNRITFKGVKLVAIKALCLWYQQKFTLEVVDYIPSPLDILKMQAQGRRCISILRTPKALVQRFDHNRNVQQFLVHDLEHAWQMFSSSESSIAQTQVSQKLLNLYYSGKIDFLFENEATTKSINYIFSDMNTHPQHTLLSLKSVLLDYYKIQTGVNKLDFLTEQEFSRQWKLVCNSLV
ncbi:MAG: hypothetical protein KDD45_15455 [Bdellovibrionales bacterium]|nr:hypothetical protein [Bdellovibrionales bacterium]